MTDFKEILVLGVGRSGSNLLCSMLRQLDGNAGFFEIFFDRKSQGLEHYPRILTQAAAILGAPSEKADEPDFLVRRDADPVAFFDALSRAAQAEGFRSMTCKIFAGQITIDTLDRLLQRPNLSVIFLTRNRIDRYISGLKGTISRNYVKEDTTELRPRLELTKFLSMAFLHDRGLDAMQDAVVRSGVRIGRLRYEDDLDVDEDLRLSRVSDALRHAGLEPQFTSVRTESWTVKQDTNPNWRDKIENGFEVAAALSGLGLLDYAQERPLTTAAKAAVKSPAQTVDPRDNSLLDQGGYNFLLTASPAVTFTAIQYSRSFFAEWMIGPEPALKAGQGLHFLKPTWTMQTTDLRPLAECLRRAEACNPGHYFVAMHVSDREEAMYREVGIRSVPGNPNLFTDERHFITDADPHPALPHSDALYIARLAPWKNHELASALEAPLFVYGNPQEASEQAQFDKLRAFCPSARFVNHELGHGRYHYLGRQEIASVMSRARVALALSTEEGVMRAAAECLLAGLPMVSVPSIGGRDLLFTSDTALIVEPTAEAVRVGVQTMRDRNLSRDEIRRATLAIIRADRQRFLDASNRLVAELLGPLAPRISIEPLLDFAIRYVPLRSMTEKLT